MLARYGNEISANCDIKIEKYINGKPLGKKGTVPSKSTLSIELSLSRRLGDGGAVLRIQRDGGHEWDIPFSFKSSEGGIDTYSIEICPVKGLYFWEILLLRGGDTLFVSSINNEDFELLPHSGRRFRLFAYDERKRPEWFYGKTMYQIFPDRFNKGNVEILPRFDAEMAPAWDSPITQYSKNPGDHLENNLFFGGTLWGIIEKLDYLESLGVGVIYLNPIFEAYSNHKYDTGDYEKVDAMFGGNEALEALIFEAKKRGMKVILDGVFNHTGSDSKYFNAKFRYNTLGAANSRASGYFPWYNFTDFPNDYESWWGIKILPRLRHHNENCRRYFTGQGGIGEKYIKMGAGGWRLDVADELSDEFLDEFRDAVKGASNGDAIIIGEVWENAIDKEAYGKRRRYFADGQLDSVMNYPLRNAIIGFCSFGDARGLYNTLTELYSTYPEANAHALMNILGTHDTERIITRLASDLGECESIDCMSNTDKASLTLTDKAYKRATEILKLASIIQFTAYGVPSIYYGDEAGLDGATDPFCRKTFPWGSEDKALLDHYTILGKIRKEEKALAYGRFDGFVLGERSMGFSREWESDKMIILASREADLLDVKLDGEYTDLISGKKYKNTVKLAPDTAMILKKTATK